MKKSEHLSAFLAKSKVKANDLEHKRKLAFNIDKYDQAVPSGKSQFLDLELARKKAKNIKWKAIENLGTYLEQFEKNFTANGGKVIWAETGEEALKAIGKICKEKQARLVVKSKSMATEEIHLNTYLEKHGITSIETDLGEYIQQLDGEPPYHIVTPAMHKSKEDVAKLFHETLGTEPNLNPQQLTQVARKKLRGEYTKADIGITGANFLLPDIGGVCVSENEGNARLSTAFPKTHIVIAGIEKMLTSVNDLQIMWPLLATYGTGQKMTVYNTIFTGPRQEKETDGPDEMYVILLDNGRSDLLHTDMRESLYCIRCGACLNACPVYKNIGGHAYGTTYSGPIGSVITPHMQGMNEYSHLSYASSLCGKCTEVCPVKINVHELLLENRHKAVQKNLNGFNENMGWALWTRAMLNRRLMNSAGPGTKTRIVNKLFADSWGEQRTDIKFAEKSFNRLWKERNKQ
ncbi:MAG: iron-sulfur cluster-binding protein [Bacteroidetes bacterium]|nr:iron-sulfur cluster-binding protein [Bacteroidota bacterium]